MHVVAKHKSGELRCPATAFIVFQGELVYVNYGRVEDYHTIENLTSLNVSGKIVLCRYGKIFRGDQVSHPVCF